MIKWRRLELDFFDNDDIKQVRFFPQIWSNWFNVAKHPLSIYIIEKHQTEDTLTSWWASWHFKSRKKVNSTVRLKLTPNKTSKPALPAFYKRNPPVSGEFPLQGPVTRNGELRHHEIHRKDRIYSDAVNSGAWKVFHRGMSFLAMKEIHCL